MEQPPDSVTLAKDLMATVKDIVSTELTESNQ